MNVSIKISNKILIHVSVIFIVRRRQEITSAHIPETDTSFNISRQQIFHQLQAQCQNILYKQQTATGSEADELSASIRSTMMGTAAIEVGAVGLGALATLASFDWTGLLGASLIGILGLYFIPMRRSSIKNEMKERIDKTRLELANQLRKHFEEELDKNERQMRELIMPYSRFVENEQKKLQNTLQQIDTVHTQIRQLKIDIQTSLLVPSKQRISE